MFDAMQVEADSGPITSDAVRPREASASEPFCRARHEANRLVAGWIGGMRQSALGREVGWFTGVRPANIGCARPCWRLGSLGGL